MAVGDLVLIPNYSPDLQTIGVQNTAVASGVTPSSNGYAPFKDLQSFTQALPSGCRGYFFARRSDSSIAIFAGTATNLYILDNTTFAWVMVSKGGVPYSSLVTSDNWSFAQFNDLVIACNVNTPPQKYTLSSGGLFVDLAGTPPAAGRVAIVNGFVVLSKLLSNPRRVQWSDLFAPETWTPGIGLSDYQEFGDGGGAFGLSGGDAYGLIFQNDCIRSMTYAPGSSTVFNFARISAQETLYAENSIINAGERTFFLAASGFKQVVPGGKPTAIGKDRVDTTFFADVDIGNLQLVIGATDPTATRVYWAYKSNSGNTGLFDKLLAYDYALDRWSIIPMSGQFIAALAKPGLTLEQLDSIAPGALKVTGAVNNGSGLIRLTLNQVSNQYFQIAGQNFIVVQGITPPYMNGSWKVSIVDSTHIDLIGSTFGAAYVSGGAIGGSLDALPFSLDSVAKSAAASLSAFGADGKLGFFIGSNIEAIVETGESDLQGNTVFIENVTPMTDSPDVLVSIGGRFTAQQTTTYTSESAVDAEGDCGVLVETRYAKARLRVPYGSVWSYLRGARPDAQAAGER